VSQVFPFEEVVKGETYPENMPLICGGQQQNQVLTTINLNDHIQQIVNLGRSNKHATFPHFHSDASNISLKNIQPGCN